LAAAQSSTSELTPEDLHAYSKAHTVLDWTSKDIRRRKEFKGLQPAESQQDLAKILQEAGERVAAFIDNFPNTTATESIQWKVDTPGFPASNAGQFRYLVVRNSAGGGETFGEYRTDAQGKEIDYSTFKGASLLTSGFTLSVLFFDPHNQGECRYRYFGRENLGGREAEVVGFAQDPEKNLRIANFHDGPRTIPLLFQGLAWIDAHSHEILRIQTDLLAPPPGTKLLRETTQIDFAPVHLPETAATFVLPHAVVVDVWQTSDVWHQGAGDSPSAHSRRGPVTTEDTSGAAQTTLHCRNIHNYSDYKLFRVESRIGPTP
jgi:hypothetical protein